MLPACPAPCRGQIAAVKAESERLRSLPSRRRLGPEQLAWLDSETKKSVKKGERPLGAAGSEERVGRRTDHKQQLRARARAGS